jgi:transglutaminase-like putative cysteine protease
VRAPRNRLSLCELRKWVSWNDDVRIRAGYRLVYDCPAPTPMLMMLSVRPERAGDLETPDRMQTDPPIKYRTYPDTYGNTCTRFVAGKGVTEFKSDFVIRDSGEPDPVHPRAGQSPIDALPDEVIQYLLASRYCELEHLNDLAWRLFGGCKPGCDRVQAVVSYVHQRITFGYEHARPTRTAYQAHDERRGVCRDYAHLAVTLCRCLNIPARYCTGYLGDIGVPPSSSPMDFSAWFEAWLDGGWRTFDARHDRPRIGRIMLAAGRDAADVAITTNFGAATLANFEVVTEELA